MISFNQIDWAIQHHETIQIQYKGEWCEVEPYALGEDKKNHSVLSAWFLSGFSESGKGPGWRLYHLCDISQARATGNKFTPARPGYKPDGGAVLHSIRRAI